MARAHGGPGGSAAGGPPALERTDRGKIRRPSGGFGPLARPPVRGHPPREPHGVPVPHAVRCGRGSRLPGFRTLSPGSPVGTGLDASAVPAVTDSPDRPADRRLPPCPPIG